MAYAIPSTQTQADSRRQALSPLRAELRIARINDTASVQREPNLLDAPNKSPLPTARRTVLRLSHDYARPAPYR